MRVSKNLVGLAIVMSVGVTAAMAESLEGRWDATVTIRGTVIPFRLDLAGEAASFTGTLFNGDIPVTPTAAKFENGTVTLNFEHYLTKIVAKVKDGQLEGTVAGRFGDQDRYISSNPFHAKRYVAPAAAEAKAPNIDGLWVIPYDSPKGEKAWRFIARQNGAEVSAAILRVDGDTGALTGAWRDTKFLLSHFDGSRPALMEITPKPDGTLDILQNGRLTNKLVAYRPEVAQAKGLPEPANFMTHTTVRDANETFAFRFPDVNGKMLSNEDPKFKGKVVVAIITGTWCPNCHDEAQYLVPLYKKYRDQGLEIVALDFEEPEQQDQLKRVKAFVDKYGVEYTYLIAGAPVEMWEKVPQLINLNTWPATVFVGRDGKVRAIHAGFAAPASGEFNLELKQEFTSTIERLLAEKVGDQNASTGLGQEIAAR
ncbi:MAG TPA: TlpA disulfide reductase family protein [Bryobacteraceae bacterium]|nr:TlpA disulfide reductase family protein [Bryobacteraceae bacterium]